MYSKETSWTEHKYENIGLTRLKIFITHTKHCVLYMQIQHYISACLRNRRVFPTSMENRPNSNAQRARRNRAKAKAELEKLKAFYAFMSNKYPGQVWEFETLFGGQNEEEAEAAAVEAVMNFDLSMLEEK